MPETQTQTQTPYAVQVRAAARLVGTAPSTVRMWCQRGVLPARKVCKSWIIRLDDLDALTRAETRKEEIAVMAS